jgi:hypothetical protein
MDGDGRIRDLASVDVTALLGASFKSLYQKRPPQTGAGY